MNSSIQINNSILFKYISSVNMPFCSFCKNIFDTCTVSVLVSICLFVCSCLFACLCICLGYFCHCLVWFKQRILDIRQNNVIKCPKLVTFAVLPNVSFLLFFSFQDDDPEDLENEGDAMFI